MSFKNELERRCYEIAERALGHGIVIEHNKSIRIETALFPEVASFKNPPAKEIDVLVAELLEQPKVVLLVSCKSLSRRAEPAHVQEWGAVCQYDESIFEGHPVLWPCHFANWILEVAVRRGLHHITSVSCPH